MFYLMHPCFMTMFAWFLEWSTKDCSILANLYLIGWQNHYLLLVCNVQQQLQLPKDFKIVTVTHPVFFLFVTQVDKMNIEVANGFSEFRAIMKN